jgi:hypothetical protein
MFTLYVVDEIYLSNLDEILIKQIWKVNLFILFVVNSVFVPFICKQNLKNCYIS